LGEQIRVPGELGERKWVPVESGNKGGFLGSLGNEGGFSHCFTGFGFRFFRYQLPGSSSGFSFFRQSIVGSFLNLCLLLRRFAFSFFKRTMVVFWVRRVVSRVRCFCKNREQLFQELVFCYDFKRIRYSSTVVNQKFEFRRA